MSKKALPAAVALLLLAGCSGGEPQRDSVQTTGELAPNVVRPGAPGEPTQTLSAQELARLRTPRHTDADVRFMRGMIHHHAQALRMTALAPERAATREVRLLAKRIDVTQDAEIELMRQWLVDRGEPAPALHRAHGHAHGAGQTMMPGMLTTAELRRLERASGDAFDRLFLHFMIRHHRGALTMVQQLYARKGGLEPEADAFARGVDADQAIEIARMQDLLAERA